MKILQAGLFVQESRAAVSVLFAAMIIPLCMFVGLAIDYSYYVQARAQLALAADAGAIQAVRVAASQYTSNNQTPAQASAAGATAGMQWFLAQVGAMSTGVIVPSNISIPPVAYDAATSSFTSTVNWTGTVPTHFGGLFKIASWPISGTSSAVITTNSFSEIDLLMDNSSSMLIGATAQDIQAIQAVTMCATTAAAVKASQPLQNYTWNFNVPVLPKSYGYGTYTTGSNPAYVYDQVVPPVPLLTPNPGTCIGYNGDPSACLYPGAIPKNPYLPLSFSASTYNPPALDANGFCPTGKGIPDAPVPLAPNQITVLANGKTSTTIPARTDSIYGANAIANMPQAPCGFACHTGDGINDYYTLVRNSGLPIQLRFDVIQAAAVQVVNTMINYQAANGVANQYALGIYEFNTGIQNVHPYALPGLFAPADTNLQQGLTDLKGITTPIIQDTADTNFPAAMQFLAQNMSIGGDGSTASKRSKNLLVVTDGLADYNATGGGRVQGPMFATYCQPLKTLGYNIYVLYTPYVPLPNTFYQQNDEQYVEPTATSSASVQLQACATKPNQYYQASSPTEIASALNAMLNSALDSPARVSN